MFSLNLQRRRFTVSHGVLTAGNARDMLAPSYKNADENVHDNLRLFTVVMFVYCGVHYYFYFEKLETYSESDRRLTELY